MIKDEMKTRVATIYEKADDACRDVLYYKDEIKQLLDKIMDLLVKIDSLQEDLECEDE